MSSSPSASLAPASDGSNSSSPGLPISAIVGIAVGIPSGVLALVGVIITFCAWRYPKTPVGRLGSAVRNQFSVRGGDARGGDAHGTEAHGGNAKGGDARAATNRNVDNPASHDVEKQQQSGTELRGGNARGGDAYGQNVYGGSAYGGSASAT